MSKGESWKIRGLRERIENENPDLAASAAVNRFEREAIAVPEELTPPVDAKPWQRRLHDDAVRLYRELVVAEPDGLTLTELHYRGMLGQQRHRNALKLLRTSGVVSESRRGPGGFDVDQIVLRAAR